MFDLMDLLDNSPSSYTIKGKKVTLINGSEQVKIPLDDFFKLSLTKCDDAYNVSFFKSDGHYVDSLSFILLGIVSSLSRAGTFYEQGTGDSSHYFLDELREYICDNYMKYLIKDLDDYKILVGKINRLFCRDSVSLDTKKKHIEDSVYKSLYLCSCFGSTPLRPAIGIQQSCLAYLLLLAQNDDLCEKAMVDIFCKFAPIIYLGGTLAFPDLVYDDNNKLEHNIISSHLKINPVNKFKFGKVSISDYSEITDIEGLSLLLATSLSVKMWGECSENFNNVLSDNINILLGNDAIYSYLIDGNIMRYIKGVVNERKQTINLGDKEYINVSSSSLWCLSEFFKDMKLYNLDISIFNNGNALTEKFFKYSSCMFILVSILNDPEIDIVNKYIHHSDLEVSKSKKEVASYKSKNNSLRQKVKSLENELQRLSSDVVTGNDLEDKLKDASAIISHRDNKIEMLNEKICELECKLKVSEESMSELLDSLEHEDIEITEEVSESDMIKFLSGFNICFVGGRTDLIDKLKEVGLYNVNQVSSLNDIPRIGNFDFIVSMTRFISHKLFYGVMSKIGSERDRHTYYNGTNLSNLICTLYKFINNYFENS